MVKSAEVFPVKMPRKMKVGPALRVELVIFSVYWVACKHISNVSVRYGGEPIPRSSKTL
jgi:hypothetical protein